MSIDNNLDGTTLNTLQRKNSYFKYNVFCKLKNKKII